MYLQQSTEITFYHPTLLTPTWLSTARRNGEVKYRIWLARRLWSGHRWKLWDLLHSLQGLWHLKVIYEYYSYHGNWILLCPDSHGNRFQLGLDFKSTGPFVNGFSVMLARATKCFFWVVACCTYSKTPRAKMYSRPRWAIYPTLMFIHPPAFDLLFMSYRSRIGFITVAEPSSRQLGFRFIFIVTSANHWKVSGPSVAFI